MAWRLPLLEPPWPVPIPDLCVTMACPHFPNTGTKKLSLQPKVLPSSPGVLVPYAQVWTVVPIIGQASAGTLLFILKLEAFRDKVPAFFVFGVQVGALEKALALWPWLRSLLFPPWSVGTHRCSRWPPDQGPFCRRRGLRKAPGQGQEQPSASQGCSLAWTRLRGSRAEVCVLGVWLGQELGGCSVEGFIPGGALAGLEYPYSAKEWSSQRGKVESQAKSPVRQVLMPFPASAAAAEVQGVRWAQWPHTAGSLVPHAAGSTGASCHLCPRPD